MSEIDLDIEMGRHVDNEIGDEWDLDNTFIIEYQYLLRHPPGLLGPGEHLQPLPERGEQ